MKIRITMEKVRQVFSFKTYSNEFDEVSRCLPYTGKGILLRRYCQNYDTIKTDFSDGKILVHFEVDCLHLMQLFAMPVLAIDMLS